MQTTLAQLKIGEKGTISEINIDGIPLKLLEMGCLPGNAVQLLQKAPLGCPLYLVINEAHVAIRLETARQIGVEIA